MACVSMQIRINLSIMALLLVLSFGGPLFGQRIMTGRVIDLYSKTPVENVTITVFASPRFSITNHLGYFQMQLEPGDSLSFTHPDYKSGGISLPDSGKLAVVYIEPYKRYPYYEEGNAALIDYLMKNLTYPRKAKNWSKEGNLFIQVNIDSSGSIDSCFALNELCSKCQDEIIEVFYKIPGCWISSPDKKNNALIFPLSFYLIRRQTPSEIPQINQPGLKIMKRISLIAKEEGQIVH
jgi:hypothetical protein